MKPIISITGNRPRKRRLTTIRILLPVASRFPTIRHQYTLLDDGRIRAWYTPDQYERCRQMFEVIKDMEAIHE
jgi:hypothetical protein